MATRILPIMAEKQGKTGIKLPYTATTNRAPYPPHKQPTSQPVGNQPHPNLLVTLIVWSLHRHLNIMRMRFAQPRCGNTNETTAVTQLFDTMRP